MFDKITEDNIRLFIDEFYNRVRKDADLGPLFTNAIGYTDEEWNPHMNKMYDFWSSVMLSTGKYSGNPMKKHTDLPSFEESMFDVWLALFAKTAREFYTESAAKKYIETSERIAQSLRLALYYRPERAL